VSENDMATAVFVLRVAALLAFAAPVLLRASGLDGRSRTTRASSNGVGRAPVIANLLAVTGFYAALLLLSVNAEAAVALPLATTGCVLALLGATLIIRSRVALGPAWSLVPRADEATGLITTGPYRLIRHPIYLGFLVLATGQALAFGSWPALLVVPLAIVPTFLWRASLEERLLDRTFGAGYAEYRARTKKIIPYLL
jgi:protein-S-isoprenylcysteine O-methyltransferase Ste14